MSRSAPDQKARGAFSFGFAPRPISSFEPVFYTLIVTNRRGVRLKHRLDLEKDAETDPSTDRRNRIRKVKLINSAQCNLLVAFQ